MPNFNSPNEFHRWIWNGSMLLLCLLRKYCMIRLRYEAKMPHRRTSGGLKSHKPTIWQVAMTEKQKETRWCTVDISIYLTKRGLSEDCSDRHITYSKQLQCLLPYLELFYTNRAEALVFVSMLSRRNIRSWTGAWLFPSLSGWERWQTRTDYSGISGWGERDGR